jgi:hypothetical protein
LCCESSENGFFLVSESLAIQESIHSSHHIQRLLGTQPLRMLFRPLQIHLTAEAPAAGRLGTSLLLADTSWGDRHWCFRAVGLGVIRLRERERSLSGPELEKLCAVLQELFPAGDSGYS